MIVKTLATGARIVLRSVYGYEVRGGGAHKCMLSCLRCTVAWKSSGETAEECCTACMAMSGGVLD